MQIDEKIALIEKEYRNYQKAEEQIEQKLELAEIKYTVEGLKRWIKRGKVILGFQVLQFEKRSFFHDILRFPCMVDFFDAEEVDDNSLWLGSNTQNVTITAMMLDQAIKRDSIQEWKQQFHEEMLGNQIYTDIQKVHEMEFLDYLCYETPTAKGNLYHVTFRMHLSDKFILGTLNCESKKKEKMGILLEALVREINDFQKEERGME